MRVTFTFLRMWESVGEWAHTLPSGPSVWELESQWIPKYSNSSLKGQNPLDWGLPYIGKLLKYRCLSSWIRKTLASTTTMSGFTFIIVVAVVSCWVDKILILKILGFRFVPNSSLLSGRSLLPLSFKIVTDFLLACCFSIWGHLSFVT